MASTDEHGRVSGGLTDGGAVVTRKRILVADLQDEIAALSALLREAHECLQHGVPSTLARRALLVRIGQALVWRGDGALPSPSPPPARARIRKIKYRDPADPFVSVWNGCGKRPKWLKRHMESGRSLAEFEVRQE